MVYLFAVEEHFEQALKRAAQMLFCRSDASCERQTGQHIFQTGVAPRHGLTGIHIDH